MMQSKQASPLRRGQRNWPPPAPCPVARPVGSLPLISQQPLLPTRLRVSLHVSQPSSRPTHLHSWPPPAPTPRGQAAWLAAPEVLMLPVGPQHFTVKVSDRTPTCLRPCSQAARLDRGLELAVQHGADVQQGLVLQGQHCIRVLRELCQGQHRVVGGGHHVIVLGGEGGGREAVGLRELVLREQQIVPLGCRLHAAEGLSTECRSRRAATLDAHNAHMKLAEALVQQGACSSSRWSCHMRPAGGRSRPKEADQW